eukprot:361479-Hanusia_phi.AAC.2
MSAAALTPHRRGGMLTLCRSVESYSAMNELNQQLLSTPPREEESASSNQIRSKVTLHPEWERD